MAKKKKQSPEEFIEAVTQSQNFADQIDGDRLAIIGADVLEEYDLDRRSMSDWLDKMEKGIDLARLVKEKRTYPHSRASNIKYPLITSAALQFNARSYPAIVSADKIVHCKVWGEDPQGLKAARGERVSAHMSWQLSSKITEWEEETDKLLVQLPIVGTMVRKVWYDSSRDCPRCRVIDAGRFIVNDKVRNIVDAPRVSEELMLYPAEITERVRDGRFLDVDLSKAEGDDEEDAKAAVEFIEQHTRLDLDGDGYDEPYIVTVHKSTQKVVRVVADFDVENVVYDTEPVEVEEEREVAPGVFALVPVAAEVPVGIKSIERGSYFVPYHFMPAMDGGFWGTGLGQLLGDITESVNSIINMLLDAGHMSSLGGGFLGSGLRLKGGAQRFSPGEWKQIGQSGGVIRDSIVPITFPEPNAVLFQLLGTLIEAGREISSTKDVMTGDSGQRTQTATTTVALIEQGMTLFTAVYKRIFRSLRHEFKLLAKINERTVAPQEYNMFLDGQQQYDPAEDYRAADMDIVPVADPRSVTRMQQAAKAQFLMEMAQAGIVDPVAAGARMLEAMDIEARDELAPKPNPMAEQMAQMQAQTEAQKAEAGVIKARADAMKAEADVMAAQTPPDHSLEIAKAQSAERVKAMEADSKMQLEREKQQREFQLEREKMAQDLLVEREKIAANIQVEMAKIQAQLATAQPEGESPQNTEVLASLRALLESVQAQIQMASAPKRVIRDDTGQLVGVETVLQ